MQPGGHAANGAGFEAGVDIIRPPPPLFPLSWLPRGGLNGRWAIGAREAEVFSRHSSQAASRFCTTVVKTWLSA